MYGIQKVHGVIRSVVIRISIILFIMAQTDAGKKKVYVHEHTKEDGTKVPPHYRLTPKTSDGKGKSKK
jgi:hypothetical protein